MKPYIYISAVIVYLAGNAWAVEYFDPGPRLWQWTEATSPVALYEVRIDHPDGMEVLYTMANSITVNHDIDGEYQVAVVATNNIGEYGPVSDSSAVYTVGEEPLPPEPEPNMCSADINGDGIVSILDFNILRQQYGNDCR